MIIGEAPGFREDDTGIPFSGKSGLFLRKMLKEIGLDPRSLFFTNTVACRPPGNRTPTRKESVICSSLYLRPQIALVKPKVILLLGNTALAWAKGKKAAVTKLEGSTFKLQQNSESTGFLGYAVTCVPSRHPSSVIRMEGEEGYDYLVQKFKENLLLFRNQLLGIKDEIQFQDSPIALRPEIPYTYTDIETNGLNPFKPDARIHTAGFAQTTDRVSSFAVDSVPREEYIKETLRKYPIIAHRATFEGTWYRQHYGITPCIYFDTKVGAYIRNENDETGLKYQAISNLNVDPWSEEQDFENPDYKTMLPYNARDTKYGLRLFKEVDVPFLKQNPKTARLLKYITFPACEVLIEVICNGFHIDMAVAKNRLDFCLLQQKNLNRKLNKIADKEVNPGSPKQMSRLLYDQLGLDCPVTTAKGKPSTSEAALIRLRGRHPATDILWDWRGWDKKRSTYLEPWIRQGPVLHANYGQTDTDTGRLNSSMVKDKRGQKKLGAVIHQCPRDVFIRNIISPRGYMPDPPHPPPEVKHPEDWGILEGDLSQIELRLAAHAAQEPTMIEIFQRDPHTPEGDIHLATAMDVLNKTQEEIDKETRKKAKAVNFGFLYGMFPPKFQAYALEKFDLKLSLKDAKDYRKGFFRKYGRLLAWHRKVEAFVRQNGWISSILGRVRHLPQVNPEYDEWVQREAVRQAINSPIQGTASDLLLVIMALVGSYSLKWDFKIDRKKAFFFGTAHDSMLSECRKDYMKEFRSGILWTVKELPRFLKKHFDVEMLVPILMDVEAYSDCWKGQVIEL